MPWHSVLPLSFVRSRVPKHRWEQRALKPRLVSRRPTTLVRAKPANSLLVPMRPRPRQWTDVSCGLARSLKRGRAQHAMRIPPLTSVLGGSLVTGATARFYPSAEFIPDPKDPRAHCTE